MRWRTPEPGGGGGGNPRQGSCEDASEPWRGKAAQPVLPADGVTAMVLRGGSSCGRSPDGGGGSRGAATLSLMLGRNEPIVNLLTISNFLDIVKCSN